MLRSPTVDRLEGLIPLEHIFVITNQQIVEATAEAAPMLLRENIIGEPIGRDTAAAVAAAGALIKSRDPEAVFAILTADQVMGDLPSFKPHSREDLSYAREGINHDWHQAYVAVTDLAILSEAFADYEGVSLESRAFCGKPTRDRADLCGIWKLCVNAGMFIWSVQD